MNGTRPEPNFGERLRKRRLDLGIGLRDLAGRVGISPTYLSRVETNDEKSPPAEAPLRALARELRLDPDEVLMRAGRVPADVAAILTSQAGWYDLIRRANSAGRDPLEIRMWLPPGALQAPGNGVEP